MYVCTNIEAQFGYYMHYFAKMDVAAGGHLANWRAIDFSQLLCQETADSIFKTLRMCVYSFGLE